MSVFRKKAPNGIGEMTDRELMEAIYKSLKDISDEVADLQEALGGKEHIEEAKALKQQLQARTSFLETVVMKVIDGQQASAKASAVAAAEAASRKPSSAVDAYIAKKNAEAGNSSGKKPNLP